VSCGWLCGFDGGEIVCCEYDVDFGEGRVGCSGRDGVGPSLLYDGFGARVVHLVCALFVVEGEFLGLGGQVCAANELNASDVALLAGAFEVLCQAGGDGAQVALVCNVDDGAVTSVVSLLQLQCPFFQAWVCEFFFGAGEE
jgi:hypothetical protein